MPQTRSDPPIGVDWPFRSTHVKFGPIWSNRRPLRALVDFQVNLNLSSQISSQFSKVIFNLFLTSEVINQGRTLQKGQIDPSGQPMAILEPFWLILTIFKRDPNFLASQISSQNFHVQILNHKSLRKQLFSIFYSF